MRYFAEIQNGIVKNVVVSDYDYIPDSMNWVEYNENEMVAIGYTYRETEGFRPPKPFDSWIWNDVDKIWDSPTPVPDEENIYEWDETVQSWIMIYKKV